MEKYKTEFKLQVVTSFLSGEGGAKLLARHLRGARRSLAKAVSRGSAANDRASGRQDSGHGQCLDTARHEAHVHLQRGTRAPTGLCLAGWRRSGAAQRSSECDRAKLRREPDVFSRRGSSQILAFRKDSSARWHSGGW